MTTIQTQATEALRFFETKKRPTGESFWTMTSLRPEWIADMAFAAHEHFLPDDFKYQFIIQALDALSECEDPDDVALEPDIYNSELTRWLGSNLQRPGYCDQAQDDGLIGETTDMFQRIAIGQYCEMQEVLAVVLSHLSDRVDQLLDLEWEDGITAEDIEATNQSLSPGKV